MLQHRTNVLLTDQQNMVLTKCSQQQKKTKGELIRYAIDIVYQVDEEDNNRELAVKKIQQLFARTDLTAKEMYNWRHEGHKV